MDLEAPNRFSRLLGPFRTHVTAVKVFWKGLCRAFLCAELTRPTSQQLISLALPCQGLQMGMRGGWALVLVSGLLGCLLAEGFLAPRAPLGGGHSVRRGAVVRMGLFDAMKKGFESEKIEGPAQNAGLKNVSPCHWTPVGVCAEGGSDLGQVTRA
jgi:hypothetical protein